MRGEHLETGKEYAYSRFETFEYSQDAKRIRVDEPSVPGWRMKWSFGSTRRVKGEVDEDGPRDHSLVTFVETGKQDRVLNRQIRMTWDDWKTLRQRQREQKEEQAKIAKKSEERVERLQKSMEGYGFEAPKRYLGSLHEDPRVRVNTSTLEQMIALIQELEQERDSLDHELSQRGDE